jgi:N,N'-diacetylchitobiose transport system permease protein
MSPKSPASAPITPGGRGAPGTPGTPGAPDSYRRPRTGIFPYALLVPSLLVLVALVGWPVVKLVITSFQHFGREQAFGKPPTWSGITNYQKIFTDRDFYIMLARSVGFMVAAVTITMVLGALVALLMQKLRRSMRLLVSLGLALAWAMPALTATIVWGWIFDTQYGVVNYVLTKITGNNWMGHSWLINPWSFFVVLTIIVVWQGVPFIAFTSYAGLSQIPHEVTEAAQIDGANARQRFFQVHVPYIRQILVVLVVLSVIWDLGIFAQVYALQGIGGIVEKTSTLGVWIYQKGTATGDYGVSAAAAVVMVFIMLAISFQWVRETIKEDEQ